MFPRLPSVRQFHDPELRLDRLEGAAADQAGLLASDLQAFDHVLLAAELARRKDVILTRPAVFSATSLAKPAAASCQLWLSPRTCPSFISTCAEAGKLSNATKAINAARTPRRWLMGDLART